MSSACVEPCTGNQSISNPRAMPSTAAIAAIPSSGPIETGPRSATRSSSDSGRTVSCVSSDPIGAGSYVTDATEGTAAGRARTTQVVRRRAMRVRPATAAGAGAAARGGPQPGLGGEVLDAGDVVVAVRPRAVVGRCDAEGAAERLGELGGLAVADPAGDLADGQALVGEQTGGALHAHPGEVLAEGRVADLRVGALQLTARRGDATRDDVDRELRRVLLVDDRDGVLEERRPVMDG